MTNVTDKFLEYGVNARTAYGTNNSATAPAVNDWTAVKVKRFFASSAGFAAQFCTDSADNYRVASPGNPLGIVPQRMPTITWREARQDDKSYVITDIDPMTGEQRYPQPGARRDQRREGTAQPGRAGHHGH